MFYVYAHIRLDTNTVFYIGKGKGRRSRKKLGRNAYWNNIVQSVGYRIEIIANNLSEKDAFNKEVELISYYKDLGQCEANLTNGGEGPSNPCEVSRKRMSDSHKGKPSFVNKRVIDTATGTIYNSVTDAALSLGIKRTTLNAQLSGQSRNKTNLKYL